MSPAGAGFGWVSNGGQSSPDVAILDDSNRLDAYECCHCIAQSAKRLPTSQQAVQYRVIALASVVPPLLINMRDTLEVRDLPVTHVLDFHDVSRCFVHADGQRPVEPDFRYGLFPKDFRRFRGPSGFQLEVDGLAILIDWAPLVPPLVTDPQVSLVDMTVQPTPTPMIAGTLDKGSCHLVWTAYRHPRLCHTKYEPCFSNYIEDRSFRQAANAATASFSVQALLARLPTQLRNRSDRVCPK